MKRKYLFDIYDLDLYVVSTEEESNRLRKMCGLDKWDANSPHCWTGTTKDKKRRVATICLPENSLRHACHESIHVAFDILTYISVSVGYKHQEALCWFADCIFSKCEEFLKMAYK